MFRKLSHCVVCSLWQSLRDERANIRINKGIFDKISINAVSRRSLKIEFAAAAADDDDDVPSIVVKQRDERNAADNDDDNDDDNDLRTSNARNWLEPLRQFYLYILEVDGLSFVFVYFFMLFISYSKIKFDFAYASSHLQIWRTNIGWQNIVLYHVAVSGSFFRCHQIYKYNIKII